MNNWEMKEIKRDSEMRIEEYLSSHGFQKYVNLKKRDLQIENFDIVVRGKLPEYFSSEDTLGTIGNKLNLEQIEFIAINYKKIASNCSTTFGFLHNEISLYSRLLEVFTKYVTIHELLHIQQIKEDRLNIEIKEAEKDKKEEEKSYEIEATKGAKRLIAEEGVLGGQFLMCINKSVLSPDEQKKFLKSIKREGLN